MLFDLINPLMLKLAFSQSQRCLHYTTKHRSQGSTATTQNHRKSSPGHKACIVVIVCCKRRNWRHSCFPQPYRNHYSAISRHPIVCSMVTLN